MIEGRNLGHDYCYYQQYLDHLAQQEDLEVQSDPLRKYATGKKIKKVFFDFFTLKLTFPMRFSFRTMYVFWTPSYSNPILILPRYFPQCANFMIFLSLSLLYGIDFGKCKSTKCAIFAILEDLNF